MHIYILISFNTWVENMASIDLDSVKLEKEVNEEINKNISIKFDDKTQKESKYMQKYAEGRLIDLGGELNIIILVTAVAMSLGFYSFYLRTLTEIFAFTIGIIFLLGGIYWVFNLKKRYKRCHKIILDAEKRILSEDIVEPKQPQESTNVPLQAQENTSSKGQSIGQIEYIKAKLDFLKIMSTNSRFRRFLTF